MGAVQSLGKTYTKLQRFVIRPQRQIYQDVDLGPVMFTFGGVRYHRKDFTVKNPRGMTLRCSHWLPASQSGGGCLGPGQSLGQQPADARAPCIVYLHGNAGSRLEAVQVLQCALAMGCSMVAFDFAGSGISEGEHVSLGWYEQHDLAAVVAYLRRAARVGRLLLWGRSMGAVTALLYAGSEAAAAAGGVAGMVLDSPFSDFGVVAAERAEHAQSKGLLMPGSSWLVPVAVAFLSSSIEAAAGFDPRNLDPMSAARRCKVPALFAFAENDDFVPPSHGRRLFAAYGGQKSLLAVPGDHNSRRPCSLYEVVAGFLEPILGAAGAAGGPRGVTVHNELLPPWETPPQSQAAWLGALFGGPPGCGAAPSVQPARHLPLQYVLAGPPEGQRGTAGQQPRGSSVPQKQQQQQPCGGSCVPSFC